MECDTIDLLMMKHMDDTLEESEKRILHEHLETCGKCKNDFEIYNEMMNAFPGQTIYAPDNFEVLVMKKIRSLPVENKKISISLDSFLCLICGICFTLIGLLFIAVLNKDAVYAYLLSNPSLNIYINVFNNIIDYTEKFLASFYETSNLIMTSISGYINSSRYLLVLIISILFMVQYVIYKKNKISA